MDGVGIPVVTNLVRTSDDDHRNVTPNYQAVTHVPHIFGFVFPFHFFLRAKANPSSLGDVLLPHNPPPPWGPWVRSVRRWSAIIDDGGAQIHVQSRVTPSSPLGDADT